MTFDSIALLFVSQLVLLSLYSAVLFVPVWVVSIVLGDRMPHLRALLWALVLVRMVIPPTFSTGWSIPAWITEPRFAHSFEESAATALASSASSHSVAGADTVFSGDLPWLLVIGWIVGFAFTLWRWYHNRSRRLELIRNTCTQPDAMTLALTDRWRRRLRISRPVDVQISAEASDPFTVGVLRPVVVLPHDCGRLTSVQLSTVIGHELSHVKRFDDLWIRLEALVRSLYFFHPVAWISAARSREVREQLADELTIRCSDLDGRGYARVLLETVALQRGGARFASGLGERTQELLRRRILRLTNHERPRLRRTAMVTGVITATALLSMGLNPSSEMRAEIERSSSIQHPLPGSRVTSPFGPRTDPFSGERSSHRGIDLAARSGREVLAAADGTVVLATESYAAAPDQGSVVVIRHPGGLTTFNSHLASILVRDGQSVRAGQPIGEAGSTGRVTGPHLHFEIWKGDDPIDPALFLGGESEGTK